MKKKIGFRFLFLKNHFLFICLKTSHKKMEETLDGRHTADQWRQPIHLHVSETEAQK
jgi:hypothetical protein